jgi:hypothetical protein
MIQTSVNLLYGADRANVHDCIGHRDELTASNKSKDTSRRQTAHWPEDGRNILRDAKPLKAFRRQLYARRIISNSHTGSTDVVPIDRYLGSREH